MRNSFIETFRKLPTEQFWGTRTKNRTWIKSEQEFVEKTLSTSNDDRKIYIGSTN